MVWTAFQTKQSCFLETSRLFSQPQRVVRSFNETNLTFLRLGVQTETLKLKIIKTVWSKKWVSQSQLVSWTNPSKTKIKPIKHQLDFDGQSQTVVSNCLITQNVFNISFFFSFFNFHRRLSVIILVPIPTSCSVIPVILYTQTGLGTGAPYPPLHTRPKQRGTRSSENKTKTSDLNPVHF